MNIQSTNSNNISMYGLPNGKKPFMKRVLQKALDLAPEHTIAEKKDTLDKLRRIDEYISNPANNRAIMMATGVIPQVIIDYLTVNNDNRDVAMSRTFSKGIIGGLTGIAVRRGTSWIIDKATDVNSKTKFGKSLLPNQSIKEISSNRVFMKNYKNTISMGLALGVMFFTNFLIDAPLTAKLTNFINAKRGITENNAQAQAKVEEADDE